MASGTGAPESELASRSALSACHTTIVAVTPAAATTNGDQRGITGRTATLSRQAAPSSPMPAIANAIPV